MKTLAIHIKTFCTLIFTLAVLLLHTGCESDTAIETALSGKGTFAPVLAVGEVQSEVITRAALDLDVADFKITLTEANGISLFDGKKLSSLTEAECTLPAGTGYRIKAENCTPDEAVTLNEGWGMAHFVASTTFDVVSNQHTPVSLTCMMDNVGLQVVFDQSFLDKFPIHAATTQDSRSLVFNQNTQDAIAYYPVEGDAVTVKLRLTGSAGGWTDRLDITKELVLAKGKIYTIHITYDERARTLQSEIKNVQIHNSNSEHLE